MYLFLETLDIQQQRSLKMTKHELYLTVERIIYSLRMFPVVEERASNIWGAVVLHWLGPNYASTFIEVFCIKLRHINRKALPTYLTYTY